MEYLLWFIGGRSPCSIIVGELCGSRYALTWSESPERAWATRAECPLNTFGTLPPFYRVCLTVFFTLSRHFFPRFTDVGGGS